MLDLMARHGVDFGHCLSKQQNTCFESKTEFFGQFIDFSSSVINRGARRNF